MSIMQFSGRQEAGVTKHNPRSLASRSRHSFQPKMSVSQTAVLPIVNMAFQGNVLNRVGPIPKRASMRRKHRRPWSTGETWFSEAIAELNDIETDIAEDGLPELSSIARKEARRILFELAWVPIAPTVFPTVDGEIAIQFVSHETARSVLIELNQQGEGACFAHVDGKNRRARYSDSSDLPDEFVRTQLTVLAKSIPR